MGRLFFRSNGGVSTLDGMERPFHEPPLRARGLFEAGA